MELIGIAGYSVAAVAYLIFLLLLTVIRNKSFVALMIMFSCAVIIVGVASAAIQVYFGLTLKYVLLAENIKLILLILLLIATQAGAATFSQLLSSNRAKKYVVVSSIVSSFCWFSSFVLDTGSKYLFLLFLMLNLWLIVLLEQLYRNAEAKVKWALWPLVISLGVVGVFDFVIYAQATMLDQLDFDFWYARGYVIALAMPFFLISTRRMKDWSVDVFVSRDVVFYSSMLMIAGGYLLILSLAGYFIKLIGGQWGGVISITFAVLGIAVLAALLLTERLRREVKVFITKHFFANKYDYRVEWLKSIDQLASNSKSDDFYKTAFDIIGSSINASGGALIRKQLNGEYKLVYQSTALIDSIELKSIVAVDEFCQKNGWIIDLREYIYVENSYPDLLLNVDYFERSRVDLIVPIINGDNLYGFFMFSLGDKRSILNWEDRDLLSAISKQLSIFLSFNEANTELSESKQFEAFHRMSAFLVHDLKNVQAQLTLINVNAEKHRENPAFIDDVFETIASATDRLDKVLNQLRNKQTAESKNKKLPLNELLNKVVQQRNVQQPSINRRFTNEYNVNVDEALLSVVNHLVQNAQEATSEGGWVNIDANISDNVIEIEITDNGCGMSEDFIKQRLFKPFDTTKGNAGMGIGVYEAKQYIESIGGKIKVKSIEGQGSTFTLLLPINE
ncbi:PEP-CTERM system histidine kinase PrsK [Thalassotalea sp. M1531]|uniref:histidine kinase n=1 Tax=Thalassotalea algicola TaxID=2716224 RepID=A0A7Y0LA24_9GAMM|nr:XrtA/PEP-CTERM system histidine kinase PrsK [Thalassotalea algicola]NMP30547.1 PEP-CTERM system histidine kinase PrsK [Thalassotalea algicola]